MKIRNVTDTHLTATQAKHIKAMIAGGHITTEAQDIQVNRTTWKAVKEIAPGWYRLSNKGHYVVTTTNDSTTPTEVQAELDRLEAAKLANLEAAKQAFREMAN